MDKKSEKADKIERWEGDFRKLVTMGLSYGLSAQDIYDIILLDLRSFPVRIIAEAEMGKKK